ncbi:Tetraspanin-1 [Aix galericulata]|nr:Tetraspanin-1 [Aix galericulata]
MRRIKTPRCSRNHHGAARLSFYPCSSPSTPFTTSLSPQLGGGALLGVGIWVTVDGQSFVKIFGGISSTVLQVVNVGYFLIVIGAILLIIGFLGCYGAQKESKCLLMMFFSVVLIIFIAEVAAAVVVLVYTSLEGRDIAWLEAGEVNHRAGAIPGRPGRAAYRLSHRQQRPRGQNAAVGEAARLPRVKGTRRDVFLALLGLRGLFPVGLGPAETFLTAVVTPVLKEKYGADEDFTRIWNATMTEVHCCGLNNYTDFEGSPWYNQNKNFPPPCCNGLSPCNEALAAASNVQGCFKQILEDIKTNADVVGGVAAGIAALEVSALSSGFGVRLGCRGAGAAPTGHHLPRGGYEPSSPGTPVGLTLFFSPRSQPWPSPCTCTAAWTRSDPRQQREAVPPPSVCRGAPDGRTTLCARCQPVHCDLRALLIY